MCCIREAKTTGEISLQIFYLKKRGKILLISSYPEAVGPENGLKTQHVKFRVEIRENSSSRSS